MSQIKKLFSKRLFVAGLMVILEIITLVILILSFAAYTIYIKIVFTILSFLIALYIIRNTRHLASDLTWIIFVLVFNVVGGIIYLLTNFNLITNKYFRKMRRVETLTRDQLIQKENILGEVKKENKYVYTDLNYLKNCYYPTYKNSSFKYYPLGDDVYKTMLNELKKAEKFIFLEYFIIDEGVFWHSVLDILLQKVKEGVDVRVIYDDIGCVNTLDKKYYKFLRENGIKTVVFNKISPFLEIFMNYRDHRKILVIDGNVAFSGGINIADEYINVKTRFGHWKDNASMVKGEAVWSYTMMFLKTWNSYNRKKEDYEKYKPTIKVKSKGYITPYGTNPLFKEKIGQDVYLNMINHATDYLYIFTPYLIIDSDMTNALILAANRGVDVKIVTPGIPDKKIINMITKSYYGILIENGVKIYEYQPGFIHSKVFISDDEIATVGTINLDYRSLYHHFECSTYLYKVDEIKNIKKDVLNTLEKSKEVKKIKTNVFTRFGQSLLRLIAPLL